MEVEITKEFIEHIEQLINEKNQASLASVFENYHPKDIAEILHGFEVEDIAYTISILDRDLSSNVLVELEEDNRKKVLKHLPSKEIADNLNEVFSDDAADVLADLSEVKKREVLDHIEDKEQAKDIVELLNYDEDTAGGLMEKELIRVNKSWTVFKCVREMRSQAESVGKVYTVYVVDDENVLLGLLSLKNLLIAPLQSKIEEIYKSSVQSVHVNMEAEEVANFMQKYDLFVAPVVDDLGCLMGRITIDDIVDLIKEEAERDYQLASGISSDVDSRDNIWNLTKARLPWLVLGLFGGVTASRIMGSFEEAINHYVELFYFTPLVAAMAGNVGVQSSAIIVQSLANNSFQSTLWERLRKEFGLSILNGCILGLLILVFGFIMNFSFIVSVTIAISLLVVIIFAGIVGTTVPIVLNKQGIDPALATGPFITTSNDIFGILIYFMLAKLILGF